MTAGDAPGHQQVHHQRIDLAQLGIRATEKRAVIGHGRASRTGQDGRPDTGHKSRHRLRAGRHSQARTTNRFKNSHPRMQE